LCRGGEWPKSNSTPLQQLVKHQGILSTACKNLGVDESFFAIGEKERFHLAVERIKVRTLNDEFKKVQERLSRERLHHQITIEKWGESAQSCKNNEINLKKKIKELDTWKHNSEFWKRNSEKWKKMATSSREKVKHTPKTILTVPSTNKDMFLDVQGNRKRDARFRDGTAVHKEAKKLREIYPK